MSGGLLVNDRIVPVVGLAITPPASHGGPAWARLDPGDYRQRSTGWIRQIIVHTTGGHWPQKLVPGAGKAGHAQQIADMWSGADRGSGQRVHSAAQLIVDFDGSVACLCDLATAGAYHAEGSNPWSIGIEMSTYPDGSITEATLAATARLVDAMCYPMFPVPRQMPRGPYRNRPIDRMETGAGATRRNTGGPSCVGVFGHRDNTSERGAGDPGDLIWRELAAFGFERLDYDGMEDISVGKDRQSALNALGARLTVDGIVGPASLQAAEKFEFARWRDVA